MPFGIISRTGPGMKQVSGEAEVKRFGDRSTGRSTFRGRIWARHCIQWGLYAVRCDSASTVGAAVWGGAAVCRNIAVLEGVNVVQGEGDAFLGGCSPFSQKEMP